MRSHTKQMIKDALLRRLNEQPLSKITVRQLCEDCGINHNTFYYYYPDIYAIIQEWFEGSLQKAKEEYDESSSWEKSFIAALQPVLANKKAIDHIYHSVSRESLENYLYRMSGGIMERFVNSITPEVSAKESDRKLIARLFQCALTEILLHWVADGMSEDPEALINRTGFLTDGMIEEALRRSAADN